jgi:hypothetical protein
MGTLMGDFVFEGAADNCFLKAGGKDLPSY